MVKPPIPSSSEPEISFSGEVPLPPNVKPVIVVKGSDYDMGYQYYEQLVQIFGRWVATHHRTGFPPHGPWVFKEIKSQDYSKEALDQIRKQEKEIQKYAPEILSMFQGMADGAANSGISLRYLDVLAHFLGYPGFPFGSGSQIDSLSACSGFAAWGKTTRDGKLICGGNGDDQIDHFSTTVIAFPDSGNNFVYSPFNIVGFGGFPCHPGMNNKGLAYVHHGGGSVPNENTGIGLPRGVAVLHTLRFASSTEEALEMYLSYSRGNEAGGLWADTKGCAVCFENGKPDIIRRPGYIEETDFLFSSNNCISRELGSSSDTYLLHAGYLGSTESTYSSIPRNLEMWNMLHYYSGQVDLDFVKMIYHFSGNPPAYPTIEEASLAYMRDKGKGWDQKIGNQLNSVVGVLAPDNGDEGLYHVCAGCVARVAYLLIALPDGANYLINPVRTFYQLKLTSSPLEVVKAARIRAQFELYYAHDELARLNCLKDNYFALDKIYNDAMTEYIKSEFYLSPEVTKPASGNESVYRCAKALRGFTRCQALARQVFEYIIPPACNPEMLGLRPYGYWEK